jgi:thioredoxin reductase (NADPH)
MGTENPVLSSSASASLSADQLARLQALGTEHSAAAGEALYRVGDSGIPFIAIIEGDVAILDGVGTELIRHGSSAFLGELNLMSGQTSLVSAVAVTDVRYVVVELNVFRELLFDDAPLSDLVLTTIIARREQLQQVQGLGIEILGPRSSPATMQILEFARSNRVPYTWHDTSRGDKPAVTALVRGVEAERLPLVLLPGGVQLYAPSAGEVSRRLGIGAELPEHVEVDLLVVGAGPAGLGAAVYGASEGLSTLVLDNRSLGGQAGFSRRIENYLGFPAGITGSELTSRAASQARKFGARMATPYRAQSFEPGTGTHVVNVEGGHRIEARAVLLATGAQYRRLPLEELPDYEGTSVFYAAGPPEARVCGGQRVAVVGGGNSAGQAAVWLARGGSLVTLLHRRADLRETMSEYLVLEIERFGVEVRDRCEIAALHGDDGQLEAVTLKSGDRMAISYLFLFLGADPCTDWLDGSVKHDEKGFILTGDAAGAESLLETSVPGVFAAGDARSGSAKRVATAVGEGAMAIQLIHAHLSNVG